MANLTETNKKPTSNLNAYSGDGQTQLAATESTGIATASVDKGGMRGVGLLAVVLAEASMKKEAIDVAKDYYKTNKKDYDFFLTTHQQPIAESVMEAMSPVINPSYDPDYYASVPAGMAQARILEKQWFEARRRAPRYAVGLQAKIDMEMAILRKHAIIAGWNLAYLYETAYAEELNNRRYNKMAEVANIGIGVANVVNQGLAQGSARLAASYDHIGDTVATIGNGLAAQTGYLQGRNSAGTRYANRTDVGTKFSKGER